MLILNAPSFFSLTWGIIKKFIDPRTAKRIQVYSNESKGLARVYELIDKSEIPTDYGGTSGRTISSILLEQANTADAALKRQDIELMHLKKRGTPQRVVFELAQGEMLTIQVYTRSISSAKFVLLKDGKEKVKEQLVKANFGGAGETSPSGGGVSPNCTIVATDILGPAKIIVEGQDQDDANKKHQGQSRGYFLIVGNVV
jgi:hypothetical protein